MFPVLLVVMAVTGTLTGAADGNAVASLATGVGTAVLALGCYAALVRWLEKRSTTELTVSDARSGLCRGAAIGFGLFTVTVLVIAMFGGYRLDGWGSLGGALTTLGLMCCAAVTEELVFRGVLFRLLEERVGTWGALAASGLIFGLVHVVKPNATLWGVLAIAIEAGLLLGAAYAATRSLWLPIGLHLAWNVSGGGIYGAVVSGSGDGTGSLLEATLTGPAALSGGSFGPEASLITVLVCGAATLVFLNLAHRRGHLRRRRDATSA
jgi:hypothetical protein